MEYQQIAVRGCCLCSVRMFSFRRVCPGTAGMVVAGLVFGTLLGPEATGPGMVYGLLFVGLWVFSGFVCFWFPGCIDRMRLPPFGGVCVGCVVWGCCLRTT